MKEKVLSILASALNFLFAISILALLAVLVLIGGDALKFIWNLGVKEEINLWQAVILILLSVIALRNK
jgi:hypothetical protein